MAAVFFHLNPKRNNEITYSFVKDSALPDFSLATLKPPDESEQEKQLTLKELVENGLASEGSNFIKIESENLYTPSKDRDEYSGTDDLERMKSLGMPDYYPYHMYLTGSGIVGSSKFKYELIFFYNVHLWRS